MSRIRPASTWAASRPPMEARTRGKYLAKIRAPMPRGLPSTSDTIAAATRGSRVSAAEIVR